MHGQTRTKVGLQDRNVLCQLCGAVHWHESVHPEQTGTDPEEPQRLLWDNVRLKQKSFLYRWTWFTVAARYDHFWPMLATELCHRTVSSSVCFCFFGYKKCLNPTMWANVQTRVFLWWGFKKKTNRSDCQIVTRGFSAKVLKYNHVYSN